MLKIEIVANLSDAKNEDVLVAELIQFMTDRGLTVVRGLPEGQQLEPGQAALSISRGHTA
jgi:hypothetical protein